MGNEYKDPARVRSDKWSKYARHDSLAEWQAAMEAALDLMPAEGWHFSRWQRFWRGLRPSWARRGKSR